MDPYSRRWYVSLPTGIVGPYTPKEIVALVPQAELKWDTPVCYEGGTEWTPLAVAFPKIKTKGGNGSRTDEVRPPKVRHGCFHLIGSVLVVLGLVGSITIIGLPIGVPMIIAGALLMIAAK